MNFTTSGIRICTVLYLACSMLMIYSYMYMIIGKWDVPTCLLDMKEMDFVWTVLQIVPGRVLDVWCMYV